MRHLKAISQNSPARAQFESALQLVGLLQSMLALFVNVANTFWIQIPHKEPVEPQN
jgi:hypothetical protein